MPQQFVPQPPDIGNFPLLGQSSFSGPYGRPMPPPDMGGLRNTGLGELGRLISGPRRPQSPTLPPNLSRDYIEKLLSLHRMGTEYPARHRALDRRNYPMDDRWQVGASPLSMRIQDMYPGERHTDSPRINIGIDEFDSDKDYMREEYDFLDDMRGEYGIDDEYIAEEILSKVSGTGVEEKLRALFEAEYA